ncbi:MAG: UDP-N-acetylglucosamine--N-acetylmuramyl-(pentapeptide) pyrophosphoryl-undecaprenol N-acetylglucosamine transferase [bacterium]|nr:UDP-N-acetylglucosamine--N-acetylmuramyl-(pentapeptide) pyrophosphoryl-undecaprenol N-acetylglucosamine transferase [bacterium]
MRILFTGGGTGGHFYPIISIAEELNALIKEKRLVGAELIYMSPTPYDAGALYENGIKYKKNSAGKMRTHPSATGMAKNFLDFFKTGWGVLSSIFKIYRLYPDVVFGKGGYASFPGLLAARILGIPVVIHESDTVPGRVSRWAGQFADKVAVSYPETVKYFPEGKVAWTGNPVRKDIAMPITTGAREFLNLEADIPVVFATGGSQGAGLINTTLIEALPRLVERCTIIHQTGKGNFKEAQALAEAVLFKSEHKDRYKPFDYLNPLAMRMAAGVSGVVVSRAGSTIFEIAAWQVPAILIPISNSNGDHQRHNAFAYARAGAGVVIEEGNFTANILVSEINRILANPEEAEKMKVAAKVFFKPGAARTIAEEILKIALSHEIEK